jgi:glycosyltransferase involved in cell wall biosynthesis
VASRLPGSTDTIIEHDVNGLLTPPGDVGALAAAIDRLLHDPGCRDRLGAAARSAIVDRFASSAIADRWLDAYQSVTRLAPG